MKPFLCRQLRLRVPLLLLVSTPLAADEITHKVLEGYPDRIQARLEAKTRFLAASPPATSQPTFEFVFRQLGRWKQGQTLRVAFRGGDTALRKDIADATADWTSHGNVKLDFGWDTGVGRHREWSPSDADYTADIRVSFDQEGYWSLVGPDSIDRSMAKPGEASLNLQGFDSGRPADWRAVALHEFGHALGFEHEHQHPTQGCDSDFRYQDDTGYVPTTDSFGQYIPDSQGRRPGIYTVLGGPPNNWPSAQVDHNLRQLNNDSHAFTFGPFDPSSIMKYAFDSWMCQQGTSSLCCSGGENTVLSPQDMAGIAQAYPTAVAASGDLSRQHQNVLREAVKVRLHPETKKRIQSMVDRPPQP
ncbi:MAG TPA: hypothetical protein VN461_22705 [Vicinamibacteria bacterium]|nr:hypothetical protein [Vicinamibacteria bacterium]